MGEQAINACDISKNYGTKRALGGVSFRVEYGEVFAYLGRNGSGKTTTVRILTGLSTPSDGRAWVAGRSIEELDRAAIGVTMQAAALDQVMTGREHLELLAGFWGLAGAAHKRTVDEALETLGLIDAADRLIRTYSGGMKRRLDLAGALLHRPKVLFLDEPTTGLDAQSRRALWDQVRKLKAAGSAIFLTTQYLEEAEELADRVAILDGGKIAAEGTPEELRRRLGGVELTLTLADGSRPARGLALAHGRVAAVEPRGIVRIPVSDASEAIQILNYVRSRWPVSGARIEAPTLEDVFLNVTGRSVADTPTVLESVA
jgi:ABC-2 type transport system ATP-binding protein